MIGSRPVVTITSIELRNLLKFFALSYNALKILRQLKTVNCKAYKSRGFWRTHYTMSLWDSREAMEAFFKNGAHREAMKRAGKIAREIRTLTVESALLPSWKEAKSRLMREGRVVRL